MNNWINANFYSKYQEFIQNVQLPWRLMDKGGSSCDITPAAITISQVTPSGTTVMHQTRLSFPMLPAARHAGPLGRWLRAYRHHPEPRWGSSFGRKILRYCIPSDLVVTHLASSGWTILYLMYGIPIVLPCVRLRPFRRSPASLQQPFSKQRRLTWRPGFKETSGLDPTDSNMLKWSGRQIMICHQLGKLCDKYKSIL